MARLPWYMLDIEEKIEDDKLTLHIMLPWYGWPFLIIDVLWSLIVMKLRRLT